MVRARRFVMPSEMPNTKATAMIASDPGTKKCSGNVPNSPRSESSRSISMRKRKYPYANAKRKKICPRNFWFLRCQRRSARRKRPTIDS